MFNVLSAGVSVAVLLSIACYCAARAHHKCNLKSYNLQHGSDKIGRRRLHQYQTMYCEVLHPYLHGEKPRMVGSAVFITALLFQVTTEE